MTDSPVRALRWIEESPLMMAIIMAVLLGYGDRASALSSLATPAIPGQSADESRQVFGARMAAAIKAHLIDGPNPAVDVLTRSEREEIKRTYEEGGASPLWIDDAGRPDQNAHDALTLLERAADDGLDPADYRNDQLERLAAALERGSPPVQDAASFDVALTAAMLRYLHHLHRGRIDPQAIGWRLRVPADCHDVAALLRSAVTGHRVAETAADLRPPLEQYGALRTMLMRYRFLAANTTPETLPPLAAAVHPGEPYSDLGALVRQLIALGDLPPETPSPSTSITYEGTLVEGVKRFQARHGLERDGVLGQRTHAALRTPLAWRVRQIELALERLRWLPHPGGERVVAISIPMFRLWAWELMPPTRTPALSMGVIVGRARRTETPVFVAEMREVIFRPYWNVPPSIARHEILPIVERDPDYLRRQGMEIVSGPGDDAHAVAATPENLARLRRGALRLRQRPGPRNALGLVKFMFPNQDNVYMHGTPAPELFSRSRRDFSHGCVRVEDPVALAEWVLGDRPEWTRDRIVAAMEGSHSLQVTLFRPIQVILFYTTAAVAADGTIHFAEDIYLHDARLERTLVHTQVSE